MVSKAEACQRLKLDVNRKYVLFPFSPTRRGKRFDLVNGAVGKLAAEGVDVKLLIASKRPNDEMPWYSSASDMMMLSPDSEGSPTSVKELWPLNVPVVTTDVGDIKETLHGIAGAEIVEQTGEGSVAAFKCVLYRPTGFVFEGRTAMQRYSHQKTVKAILKVYHRVIERRSTGLVSGRAVQRLPISSNQR